MEVNSTALTESATILREIQSLRKKVESLEEELRNGGGTGKAEKQGAIKEEHADGK